MQDAESKVARDDGGAQPASVDAGGPGRLRRALAYGGDKLLVPTLSAVISGLVVGLVVWKLTVDHPAVAVTTTPTHWVWTPDLGPAYPPVVRGVGTETTHATGIYTGEPFRARSALAYSIARQGVWIVLLPRFVTCSTWRLGNDEPRYFTIEVSTAPSIVHSLPIGRPLRGFSLWWDGVVNGQANLDETGPGRVTLTMVDTHPGGYWRGRVLAKKAKSAGQHRQRLRGTFAAEWCGGKS